MKGLCCAAQKAGDLGKPLIITVTRKDGTHAERCGVCEVRPSCSNQAKPVFAFRFLPAGVCNLAAAKCGPTPAGIAQYNQERITASPGGARETTAYSPVGGNGTPIHFTTRALPGPEYPYALPAPPAHPVF